MTANAPHLALVDMSLVAGAGRADDGAERRAAPRPGLLRSAWTRSAEGLAVSLSTLHALARADSSGAILRSLADVAVTELGADGAAIVEILPSGDRRLAETRNAGAALERWRAAVDQVDQVDDALGARLLDAAEGRFADARTLVLTREGGSSGALVMFSTKPMAPGDAASTTAEAIVAIAATELDKERRRAELQRSYDELRASRFALEQTERLLALSEMAAGVAHVLANVLSPLSLHLQLLQRTTKRSAAAGQAAEQSVADMMSVVKRGIQTVERLRDFSRQRPEARVEPVELDAIAREAIDLAHPRIASKRRARAIQIVARLKAPPPVAARSSELMTALLNLLVNAVDAMECGGTITVTTGASDGGAWVQVADDGPGIPEELQRRVFEPFFTTKGDVGTGLGLALVHACAQRYGGTLRLDSAVGLGARFTLWFPLAAAPSEDDGAASQAPAPAARRPGAET